MSMVFEAPLDFEKHKLWEGGGRGGGVLHASVMTMAVREFEVKMRF